MQLRLGQVLFGAIAAGVITAAGTADAGASASGKMEVRKRILLNPAVSSAQVQGTIYRRTKGTAQGASAIATTSNTPKAFKNLSGLGVAVAQVSGWAHADFLGAGEAVTHGYMNGFPVRLAKLRPTSAKGYATALGEGYVFQIMQPMVANAKASGFGTTYHLVYGHASGEAQASGQVAWRAGVHGEAVATAQLNGWVEYTAMMYGGEALCESHARSEPAVRIDGVRYLDAWGIADASAQCVLTNWAYYPSVMAKAYANAQVTANYQLGGAGHGQAVAVLEGTMIGASTSAGVVQSDSIAVASGRCRSFPKGYGNASVTASGSGEALIKKTGLGRCEGIARSIAAQVIDAVVINTKANPDDGYGVAQGRAIMNRVRSMSGRAAETFAIGAGGSVKTQFVHGVANGIGVLAGLQYRTTVVKVIAVEAEALLMAHMQVDVYPPVVIAEANATGLMEKNVFVSGEALAFASAVGANQVNDAVKAPATRTVIVTQESRTTVVSAESRTVIV